MSKNENTMAKKQRHVEEDTMAKKKKENLCHCIFASSSSYHCFFAIVSSLITSAHRHRIFASSSSYLHFFAIVSSLINSLHRHCVFASSPPYSLRSHRIFVSVSLLLRQHIFASFYFNPKLRKIFWEGMKRNPKLQVCNWISAISLIQISISNVWDL